MMAIDAAGQWEPSTGQELVTCGECGLHLRLDPVKAIV